MATPTLRRWSAQAQASGGASAVLIKAADDALSYIYVTEIRFNIMGHANAKTTFFEDSAVSSYQIAQFDDLTVATGTPGTNGTVIFTFGKRGVKLGIGKNFQVRSQASGTSGNVTADGYQSAV
jgi:hypothetical protein